MVKLRVHLTGEFGGLPNTVSAPSALSMVKFGACCDMHLTHALSDCSKACTCVFYAMFLVANAGVGWSMFEPASATQLALTFTVFGDGVVLWSLLETVMTLRLLQRGTDIDN